MGYATPEQFGGSQFDARMEILGLSKTMFRLITGVDPNLSKGLEYIISKCIQPDP